MEKKQSRARLKYGQDPGSLIYVGDVRTREVTLNLVIFSKDDYSESDSFSEDVIKNAVNEGKTIWLNINGIHDTDIISKTGKVFNIHPLTLEDILNTHHRPKTEDVNDYLFVVLKHLSKKENSGTLSTEQISLIIHKNFVITFQEDETDDLNLIRESLRQNKGKIRELAPDYLAYRIIDIIVDSYFDIVEDTGEKIERLGDELVQ
ncbi:MAG: CorA family divalent cation transporter, partial [Syntrophothermus sp.]